MSPSIYEQYDIKIDQNEPKNKQKKRTKEQKKWIKSKAMIGSGHLQFGTKWLDDLSDPFKNIQQMNETFRHDPWDQVVEKEEMETMLEYHIREFDELINAKDTSTVIPPSLKFIHYLIFILII